MRSRSVFSPLRVFSVFFIIAAVLLTTFQLIRYSRVRSFLPNGLRIAGVAVGGLDRQQAAQRLLEAYTIPVELRYNEAVIHLTPGVVDFQLDLDAMLSAAEQERTRKLFWQGFWDYLWSQPSAPVEIPLRVTYSEARLRTYLTTEIAARYDRPPTPALPQPGTVNFQPGKPGTQLDVDGSVTLIELALRSLTQRQVNLPLERAEPSRPAFGNLQILLRQTLQVAGFEGVAGVYLLDLQTGQEIHFGYNNGQDLPVEPDIAFTASSIIKIPIMVSAFRRMNLDSDAEAVKLMKDMIEKSGNEAADWLMDRTVDDVRGPLLVSEDMQALGLKNTFLAGYFALGSSLLRGYETPANTRIDINTDPDPYSQTTPSDIGMLLEDIYQCSQSNGSALRAAFPDDITQAECVAMVTYLVNNHLPVLLTGGIPEGMQIAHKHGWVSTNGIINTIGDAGIIYSPGGNYVMVVFLHDPVQLIWEPASKLVADLSLAVYKYYNLPGQ